MTGTCSICLQQRELTFEHVPPRRVFNDRPAVAHTIYGLHLGSTHKKEPALLKAPGGLGRRTICEGCNGLTGAWYGDAFADWSMQCLTYAARLGGLENVLLPFHIKPLNVVKQIVVMALAVSGSKTGGNAIDELRRFVLVRQAMSLPPEFVVSCYFNPNDPARAGQPALTQNRLAESCGILDVRSGTSVFVVAEVAFPPMGYVIYAAPLRQRVSSDFASLCNLRSFTESYFGQTRSCFMNIAIRYPFGPVPGYYPNLNKKGVPFLSDDHILLSANDASPKLK